jgi:phytoene dehydrogenase-like protein
MKVLILEKHFLPGGFCTSWERHVAWGPQRLRYIFDAGVHDVSGLGPRGPLRNLLHQLDIQEQIEWRRVAHEYILPGCRLHVPDDPAQFTRVLVEQFPQEEHSIPKFMCEIRSIYDDIYADVDRTGGVPRTPRSAEELKAYPMRHPNLYRWFGVTFQDMLDEFFMNPELKRVLLLLRRYSSDGNQALSVHDMAHVFGYYFDGGYYPVGGSQALPDALVSVVRAHRGCVRLSTPVRRILIGNGRAIGVELHSGERQFAGTIVSNSDVLYTFRDLVGTEHVAGQFARRVVDMKPANSAFMVFLGLDYVPDVSANTFVSYEEHKLLIAIPSKVDSQLAPPGHASMTLVTMVPRDEAETWDRHSLGYVARKQRFGDDLVRAAEQAVPGLRDHIVYRDEATPATFARYCWTTGGSIYGLTARQRLRSPQAPIPGLLLVGAGVSPGPGIEGVVISGTVAADMVCADVAAARPDTEGER